MRRYDDPVEVRRGWVSGPGHQGDGPEQFLWHGRVWKVRSVLARWVETGAWWQSTAAHAVIGTDEPAPPAAAGGRDCGDLLVERELWRVEAGRGLAADGTRDGGGVFDLAHDGSDGRWQLVGCVD